MGKQAVNRMKKVRIPGRWGRQSVFGGRPKEKKRAREKVEA